MTQNFKAMAEAEILQQILMLACPSSGPRENVREYEIDVHCVRITLSAKYDPIEGFTNIQIIKTEDN